MTRDPVGLPHRESQPFHFLLLALGAVAVVFAVAALVVPEGTTWLFLIPMVPVLGVLAFMHRLETVVDGEGIAITFGHGPFQTRARWSEVSGARRAHASWMWGYGLRLIPRGWLWRVRNNELVEIELASGRRTVVGTDDAEALLAAIAAARVRSAATSRA